jgi:hypothetical protein
VQYLHIAFFVKFPFAEYIAYMLGYDASFTLKQIGHLSLGQPCGIRIIGNFDFG